MYYCTLEEAWGNTLTKKKTKKSKKKELEQFIDINKNDTDHLNTHLDSDIQSNDTHRYDFSRDVLPLPQHNGNEERIKIEDNYVIGEGDDDTALPEPDNNNEIQSTNDKNKESNNSNYQLELLLQKMNELMDKLETEQGNTLQEIILFSMIGVFIIFVLDSFVKIGKMQQT
tara:strand:- start:1222 stop:1734 length:513 start_codon:yes stop_codon:yes gene_type:complete